MSEFMMKGKRACTHDPSEKENILGEIKCIMEKLGAEPCQPKITMPCSLDSLCRKQPRCTPDLDTMPHITHVPVFEMRPTSEYRKVVGSEKEMLGVKYVPVDPPRDPFTTIPCPFHGPCDCCPKTEKLRMLGM